MLSNTYSTRGSYQPRNTVSAGIRSRDYLGKKSTRGAEVTLGKKYTRPGTSTLGSKLT